MQMYSLYVLPLLLSLDRLLVIKSKDVKVGDILRLEGEDQVPADMLIVSLDHFSVRQLPYDIEF